MSLKSFFSDKALGALAVVAVAAVVAGCSGGAAAPAAPSVPGGAYANTISVTGSGDAEGQPDMASVQLGIDVAESDIDTAMKKANDTMTAVQAAVKGKGIEDKDLQTSNFNVYPEDVTDPSSGQPTGQRRYHVQNFLNVTVHDTSKVGEIIDAGLTAGATNVAGLTFGVQDTTKLEADARAKALKDAQARAQQLADAIGVKLGKPVIISETLGGNVPVPMFEAARSAAGVGGAGAPPISVGQQTVTVTVNVTYAIGQ